MNAATGLVFIDSEESHTTFGLDYFAIQSCQTDSTNY